ncbi:class I SAM-dependent methyltransferase [Picosynechococcus sp. PCC 7002]|uniref:class I SAM-dependent methyltransferase n=1 Tax=Picosynechococcus sp. (strain ATCC 27264 / PCC 7002 / PR-6) TaxID=32049 RepID=UPI0030D87C39
MKLNQAMKAVIDATIAKQYEQQSTCEVWRKTVMRKDDSAQRYHILRQGKADFMAGEAGLSPLQTVILYCRHYMQMHLASSRYLFKLFSMAKSTVDYPLHTDGVTMIDFGCGPMTSGLALATHIQELHQKKATINYIGIDHSAAMLEMAAVFSDRRELFTTASNFQFQQKCHHAEELIEMINHLEKDGPKSTIILNFSYLFASETLDHKQLAHTINGLLKYFGERKIVFFFQNPPGDYLNKKWILFKEELAFNLESTTNQIFVPYYEYQFFKTNKVDVPKRAINLYYEILRNY